MYNKGELSKESTKLLQVLYEWQIKVTCKTEKVTKTEKFSGKQDDLDYEE